MTKIFLAVVAAALIAGVVTLTTAPAPIAEKSNTRHGAKEDRLDIRPLDFTCSYSPWPVYQRNCLGRAKQPARPTTGVRVVTADQLNSTD
jgi:hypothetical protein